MTSLTRLKHICEYLFLWCLIFLANTLPLKLTLLFARRLADFAFFVLRARIPLTLKNLNIAFGKSKSQHELYIIARKTYQNFFMTAIEMVRLLKLSHAEINKLVTLQGREHIDNALKKGNGIIFVAGHFGNAEIMGFSLRSYGYPTNFILGEFRNKYSDNLLIRMRKQAGISTIPRKYALRNVLQVLKNNEIVALLSDQNAGPTGAFVEFFGRPTSTPKGAAMFALKAKSAIIMGHSLPDKDRSHHTVFLEPIEAKLTGNKDMDAFNITQAFTKKLEEYATKYPEHYFWIHNRWKASPPIGG